jgi:hypothetical protein
MGFFGHCDVGCSLNTQVYVLGIVHMHKDGFIGHLSAPAVLLKNNDPTPASDPIL